jgi:hypothetical protein
MFTAIYLSANFRRDRVDLDKKRGFWAALMTVIALLLVSSSVLAQGSAVLTGRVISTDTKQPIADVVVTATSPNLQGEQLVVTDAAGEYRIPNLPPGTYDLRLAKETYRPLSRGGITVRVGTTIRVNVELLPEVIKAAEEIEVVGKAPTVDVGSSSTGAHIDADFINRVPLIAPSAKGAATRSFESLAAVAPGAAPDRYGVSVNGTTSPENQYVIDGVSVNNPAFGYAGTALSVEFVKEMNVITGGYMPEYGRATGGYFDVVTKSGSNQFHGSAFFSITPGIFEGAREPVARENSTITTDISLASLRDFGFDIGGPIIKDKLWFYLGVSPSFATYRLERNLNLFQNGTTSPIPGTQRIYYATQSTVQYLGKLTWLVNPDNTVTLSVYGVPTTSGGDGNFGLNPTDGFVEIVTNPDAGGNINGSFSALAHKYVSNSTDAAIKWSSAFMNKRLLFDTTLGWHHEDNSKLAADGTEVGSGQGWSNLSQVRWQRSPEHGINDFEPTAATAGCDPAGTLDAELCPVATYISGGPDDLRNASLDRVHGKTAVTGLFSALGHHVVKAGFDFEWMRYASVRGRSGFNTYIESTDGTEFSDFRRFGFLQGPDVDVLVEKFQAVSSSTTVGGFVQDSWSIADMVTLNAGVRYDAQLLYGYDGNLAMALPNQVSPRVGLIYDFTRQGRSKIFANYGRFYESVPLDMVDRSIPGERQITSVYDAAQCNQSPANFSCPDSARSVIGDVYSPNQKWGAVGSDKTPVDPDIMPQSSDELVVGGEYEVISNARLGLQYTKRWQNHVIEDMSRDEAWTYFLGNPGYGIATDFPKATRDYDALTIYGQKSFSDLWLAQVSYTLSYLRGNWAGLFRPENGQFDPNINSDFDLITLIPNRQGPLAGDSTHQIKVYGAKDFVLPGGMLINVGATYRTHSGGPTNYLGSHNIYGPNQVFILPRGSGERLPWIHDIDAQVGFGLKLAKDSTIFLSLDVFNIFNFQGVTKIDEIYTLASVLPIENKTANELGELKYDDGSAFDPADLNTNFGNPTEYQPPRSFRFGAKVTF